MKNGKKTQELGRGGEKRMNCRKIEMDKIDSTSRKSNTLITVGEIGEVINFLPLKKRVETDKFTVE